MSKAQEDKERKERFYLDEFFRTLSTKPESVKRGDDPPDFIAIIDGKRIAIEETEFHSSATGANGHPRRAIEEEWQKFQKLIEQERMKDSDLNKVYGRLSFKCLQVPSRNEQATFVEELLEFSRGRLKSLTGKRSDFTSFGQSFPLLSKYLRKFQLSTVCGGLTWEWNDGRWVGLSESELQKTISGKLNIARPTNAEENWLLVVSGHQLSQSMGLPNVEKLRSFNQLNEDLVGGPYDKVYIFQYMFESILLWQPSDGWTEVRKAHFASK